MLKAGFCISWASSTCRCLSHSRYTCIRLPGSRARRTPRHYNTPCTAQCTIIKPKCQVHQQFHFSAIFSNTPSIPHSLRSTVFHSLSFSIDAPGFDGFFLFVTFLISHRHFWLLLISFASSGTAARLRSGITVLVVCRARLSARGKT